MPISHAHIRSFHAVAAQGSFTKAAKLLHITQPTLSGQVKELEKRYGVKLFSRHGGTVELTALGRSAFIITQKLFRHEEEMEQLLLSAQGLTTGELRVGADSPYIITPLLARFQRRYPDIQIAIKYGNSSQVLRWLERGQCDIAIVPNRPAKAARLDAVLLTSDQLVLFVSREHPWAMRKKVGIKDIAKQQIILREPGSSTRAIFEDALSERGVTLAERMEIGSREGVREAVAAGFGVGVVAESELGGDPRFHVLKVTNVNLTYSEFAIRHKHSRSVRVTDAFFELVEEVRREKK